MAAEVGIAAFRIAFARLVNEAKPGKLSPLIRESLDELKAVAAGR